MVSWVRENIKETSSDEIVVLLEKIVDPSFGEEFDMKEMEELLKVAMKCVEEDKGTRPTMGQVVGHCLQRSQNHNYEIESGRVNMKSQISDSQNREQLQLPLLCSAEADQP
ncbi:hypothetical protein FEM48_Zijuj02G0103400 [Ziziphus jujuba var. spinosa]|uniref:Uncharacterized protein n=1 Tax=Ziziphus jujuba var. spinosa TaxID=714518 RepID=A0A978VV68_ZIZJJ|nr:hypothetical protein FEM48_Zijuj02G0103400 [Ziziphus jujuba var. spinosa]